MMQKIELTWKGEDFTIPESEVFEVGEQIEEIVTLGELSAMSSKPQFRKLSRCFSVMINHAGGTATPAEVHSMMMEQIKAGTGRGDLATAAISTLVEILMDGAPERDGDEGSEKKAASSSKTVI